jgi:hypothetical protein
MALKELSPIHFAISSIDNTIADLQNRKRELQALLPEETKCRRVDIVDPRGPRRNKQAARK